MPSISDVSRRMCLAMERARPEAISACIAHLDCAEARWVERQNRMTRKRWLRVCAILLTKSANGWIYLPLALGLVATGERRYLGAVFAGGLSALIAYAIYPLAKAFVARPRPFASHETMEAVGTPLDRYSFPSGHCMAATVVVVAVGSAIPQTIPLGVAFCALLAWARMACAHHYPSDLLCGSVLGVAVAAPVCQWILR